MTTDYAEYKALPAEERDELGFARWREEQRIGTHCDGCWAFGPRHNECAQREIARLQKDKERLDFLVDPAQSIANITLPYEIVMQNLHSLRDAIDAAMALSRQHQTTP